MVFLYIYSAIARQKIAAQTKWWQFDYFSLSENIAYLSAYDCVQVSAQLCGILTLQ